MEHLTSYAVLENAGCQEEKLASVKVLARALPDVPERRPGWAGGMRPADLGGFQTPPLQRNS